MIVRLALAGLFALFAVAAHADEIRLSVGQTQDLTLSENPSTGYSWAIDTSASKGLGKVVAVDDAGHTPGAAMPGAPGTHRWTIRGLAHGTATLVLLYKRPWEKSVGETRQYRIDVAR